VLLLLLLVLLLLLLLMKVSVLQKRCFVLLWRQELRLRRSQVHCMKTLLEVLHDAAMTRYGLDLLRLVVVLGVSLLLMLVLVLVLVSLA